MVLQRFTARAKRVIENAVDEARRRGEPVGPLHLLLALARDESSAAGRALREAGVTPEAVAGHLVEPADGTASRKEPPFDPEGKRVLEQGARWAKELRHPYIGAEHVLLALLDDGAAAAADVWRALGVDVARLRERLLAQPPQPEERPGHKTQVSWVFWRSGGESRDWVVSVRLDAPTLTAVDALVRAGVAKSRSEAVFMLCRKGIEAHRELFDRLAEKMASVAELEEQMRRIFAGDGGET